MLAVQMAMIGLKDCQDIVISIYLYNVLCLYAEKKPFSHRQRTHTHIYIHRHRNESSTKRQMERNNHAYHREFESNQVHKCISASDPFRFCYAIQNRNFYPNPQNTKRQEIASE